MLVTSLTGLALSVGAVHAFVLPHNLGLGLAEVDSSSAPVNVESLTQTVKLGCPECVLSRPEESETGTDALWTPGGANSVVLNFSLSADIKQLNMNGYKIYPASLVFGRPSVEQVPSTASLVEIKAHQNHDTVHVSADAVMVEEEIVQAPADVHVRATYQIGSLEHRPVSVDAVLVNMLRKESGELYLISVEPVPRRPELESVSPTGCHGLPAFLCNLNSAVDDKVNSMRKGCPGMRRPAFLLPPTKSEAGTEAEHIAAAPFAHQIDAPARHQLAIFAQTFLVILLPIMAGFIIGMTVSFIGMLVGRLIAYLWVKYVRGGKRSQGEYLIIVEATGDDADSPDRESFEDEKYGSLPAYEEAPAYRSDAEDEKEEL